MEKEIAEFADAIGAVRPQLEPESQKVLDANFRRGHYFTLSGNFLIIKLSRSKKPFWGLNKAIFEFLEPLGKAHLVLLVPGNEGWVYDFRAVRQNMNNGVWNTDSKGYEYKINAHTLKDDKAFAGPKTFMKKLGIN